MKISRIGYATAIALVMVGICSYVNHVIRLRWDASYERTLSSYQHLYTVYGRFDGDAAAYDERLRDFEHNTDDLVSTQRPYYGSHDAATREQMVENLKDCGRWVDQSHDIPRTISEAIRNHDREAVQSADKDFDEHVMKIADCSIDGNPANFFRPN
jgi:hypothetical protein